MNAEQLTDLAAQAYPDLQSHFPMFQQPALSETKGSTVSTFHPSTLPILHSSNLPSTPFVPQTTNVEKSPITNNGARKLSLKSQESDLFLEKAFFNFFYSKITASVSHPLPLVYHHSRFSL